MAVEDCQERPGLLSQYPPQIGFISIEFRALADFAL